MMMIERSGQFGKKSEKKRDEIEMVEGVMRKW